MGLANRKLRVMSLSQTAAERIRDQIERSEKPMIGLRVGVKNGGCAGMSYTMDLTESVGPLDEVVEDHGVKLVIDAKAVLFLLGTTLDVKTDKFSSGFVFVNPNETSACGCGESVAIAPATPEALAAAGG